MRKVYKRTYAQRKPMGAAVKLAWARRKAHTAVQVTDPTVYLSGCVVPGKAFKTSKSFNFCPYCGEDLQ